MNQHAESSRLSGETVAGDSERGSAVVPQRVVRLPEGQAFYARVAENTKALRQSPLDDNFIIRGVSDNTFLFSPIEICASLQALAQSSELFSQQQPEQPLVFFDLGCGSGRTLIAVAHEGWLALGVDLNQNCITDAEKNIQMGLQSSYIESARVKVQHGNFFPSDFAPERLGSAALDPSGAKLSDLAKAAPQWESIAPLLGRELNQVDMFYHFQVERTLNILSLFSKYAKPGAILALARTIHGEPPEQACSGVTFLGYIGPSAQWSPISLFEKVS